MCISKHATLEYSGERQGAREYASVAVTDYFPREDGRSNLRLLVFFGNRNRNLPEETLTQTDRAVWMRHSDYAQLLHVRFASIHEHEFRTLRSCWNFRG
jgi:hypothetical protein